MHNPDARLFSIVCGDCILIADDRKNFAATVVSGCTELCCCYYAIITIPG